jgi:hypothetical protein
MLLQISGRPQATSGTLVLEPAASPGEGGAQPSFFFAVHGTVSKPIFAPPHAPLQAAGTWWCGTRHRQAPALASHSSRPPLPRRPRRKAWGSPATGYSERTACGGPLHQGGQPLPGACHSRGGSNCLEHATAEGMPLTAACSPPCLPPAPLAAAPSCAATPWAAARTLGPTRALLRA